MNISQFNKLVQYYIGNETDYITEEEKKYFDLYIIKNKKYIYAKIFFEYSQLDIDNKSAKKFLKNVTFSMFNIDLRNSYLLELAVHRIYYTFS